MQNKSSVPKHLLISLIVTLGLLGAVIGASFWYQSWQNVVFDLKTMIICDAVGAVVMFFLVFLFLHRPEKKE